MTPAEPGSRAVIDRLPPALEALRGAGGMQSVLLAGGMGGGRDGAPDYVRELRQQVKVRDMAYCWRFGCCVCGISHVLL